MRRFRGLSFNNHANGAVPVEINRLVCRSGTDRSRAVRSSAYITGLGIRLKMYMDHILRGPRRTRPQHRATTVMARVEERPTPVASASCNCTWPISAAILPNNGAVASNPRCAWRTRGHRSALTAKGISPARTPICRASGTRQRPFPLPKRRFPPRPGRAPAW